MRRHLRWAAAGVATLLAACANPAAERAVSARTALVGLPKTELLACAGVPNRQTEEAGVEYLTYDTVPEVTDYGPTASLGVGGITGGRVGLGVGFGFPLTGHRVVQRSCQATFVVSEGIVREIRYRSDYVAECADIIDPCLGR